MTIDALPGRARRSNRSRKTEPTMAIGETDANIVACPSCARPLDAGVSRLFRIGGAHAVAALAYGTESVPRVDKIVGPGNVYVAEA